MTTFFRTALKVTGLVLGTWIATDLTGCIKHEPPPLETLGAAKMAVRDAERNDHTAELAPAELQSAQQKVNAAIQALERRDNINARRLSEQAIVDAQLAKAKTLTAKSTIGVREEGDALHDLQVEIQRNK